MGAFRLDSPLMRGLSYIADLIILNFVYLVFCLPIFTIGAATTALYRVMLNFEKKEDAKPTVQFWQAFRSNFKKATLLWLIMLLPVALLVYYLLMILSRGPGVNTQFLLFSAIAMAVVAMTWSFLWPLQAQFENTVGSTLKNAVLLSTRHLPSALLAAFLNILPFLLFLFYPAFFLSVSFFWLLIGFSLTALLNTKLILKAFRPFLPQELSDTEQQNQ